MKILCVVLTKRANFEICFKRRDTQIAKMTTDVKIVTTF